MAMNQVVTPKHDFIVPMHMGENTVLTKGIWNNSKTKEKKLAELIPNGTIAQVFDNQFMIIVDGGKIIDWTNEPGYYEIVNSSARKGFLGKLTSSGGQQIYYINTKEISGIRFGTQTPINYYDSFYEAELFLRCHGTYSIRISDPIRFYEEVVSKDSDEIFIEEINAQHSGEFMTALATVINKMSKEGERISFLSSKATELSEYMAGCLDKDWKVFRGIEIESVAIASISYDDASMALIQKKNDK